MKVAMAGKGDVLKKPDKIRPHRAVRTKTVVWDEKINDILRNMDSYHKVFYATETFHGPSLYFHQRAFETRDNPTSITHLEYVYATLSSWGMHRMGKGGSKMQPFSTFKYGVKCLKEKIIKAQNFECADIAEEKWCVIRDIFQNMNVMRSQTSLVGNSKAMHHMMPNIVPPIDREYTLWFLFGNTTIKNDLEHE